MRNAVNVFEDETVNFIFILVTSGHHPSPRGFEDACETSTRSFSVHRVMRAELTRECNPSSGMRPKKSRRAVCYRNSYSSPIFLKLGVSGYVPRAPRPVCSSSDEVTIMHAPLIIGIVVLALLVLALVRMLPDLVRYMKIRSM
jgi:hypothetical protein